MPDTPRLNSRAGNRKIEKTMGEFKAGTLRSSSGEKVTDRDQAVAIALRQGRKARKRVRQRARERAAA